ncbi:MAG: Gfo/Idh/MocA family oxidoreductase [Deinococcales bacterium]
MNITLVGAGRMGWIFAKAIAGLHPARLAFVVSRSLESAQKMGEHFGCRISTNLEEVLEPSDAVVIATPTLTHKDLAILCAKAGKPFFVEKPIADSLENGKEMVIAAEKHSVQSMVGFQRRFDPAFVQAKKHIEAGGIGKLEIFRSISRDASMGSSSLEWHLQSGGLIVDLGVHDMDLARWFMGEVVAVQSFGGALTDPGLSRHGLHDTAVAILQFASGAFGTIEMGRNTAYGHEVRAEILGAAGKCSIERDQRGDLRIYDASGGSFDRPRGFEERFAQAYIEEMAAFVRGVMHQETLMPNVRDAWYSLRLAMAAQKALDTGQTVRVEEFGGAL